MSRFTHLLAVTLGSECMSTINKTAEQYIEKENISQVSTTSDAMAYLEAFYASDVKLPVIVFLDTSVHYHKCLELVQIIDKKFDGALNDKVVLVNANLNINKTMRMAVSKCVNNFMTCPVFRYEVETLLNSMQPAYAKAV